MRVSRHQRSWQTAKRISSMFSSLDSRITAANSSHGSEVITEVSNLPSWAIRRAANMIVSFVLSASRFLLRMADWKSRTYCMVKDTTVLRTTVRRTVPYRIYGTVLRTNRNDRSPIIAYGTTDMTYSTVQVHLYSTYRTGTSKTPYFTDNSGQFLEPTRIAQRHST